MYEIPTAFGGTSLPERPVPLHPALLPPSALPPATTHLSRMTEETNKLKRLTHMNVQPKCSSSYDNDQINRSNRMIVPKIHTLRD